MCKYIFECVRVCTHLFVYLRKYTGSAHVYAYLGLYTCIYASVRECTPMYLYLRICTYVYPRTRGFSHMYMYIRMCPSIYACVRISTHVYVYPFSSVVDAYALHLTVFVFNIFFSSCNKFAAFD